MTVYVVKLDPIYERFVNVLFKENVYDLVRQSDNGKYLVSNEERIVSFDPESCEFGQKFEPVEVLGGESNSRPVEGFLDAAPVDLSKSVSKQIELANRPLAKHQCAVSSSDLGSSYSSVFCSNGYTPLSPLLDENAQPIYICDSAREDREIRKSRRSDRDSGISVESSATSTPLTGTLESVWNWTSSVNVGETGMFDMSGKMLRNESVFSDEVFSEAESASWSAKNLVSVQFISGEKPEMFASESEVFIEDSEDKLFLEGQSPWDKSIDACIDSCGDFDSSRESCESLQNSESTGSSDNAVDELIAVFEALKGSSLEGGLKDTCDNSVCIDTDSDTLQDGSSALDDLDGILSVLQELKEKANAGNREIKRSEEISADFCERELEALPQHLECRDFERVTDREIDNKVVDQLLSVLYELQEKSRVTGKELRDFSFDNKQGCFEDKHSSGESETIDKILTVLHDLQCRYKLGENNNDLQGPELLLDRGANSATHQDLFTEQGDSETQESVDVSSVLLVLKELEKKAIADMLHPEVALAQTSDVNCSYGQEVGGLTDSHQLKLNGDNDIRKILSVFHELENICVATRESRDQDYDSPKTASGFNNRSECDTGLEKTDGSGTDSNASEEKFFVECKFAKKNEDDVELSNYGCHKNQQQESIRHDKHTCDVSVPGKGVYRPSLDGKFYSETSRPQDGLDTHEHKIRPVVDLNENDDSITADRFVAGMTLENIHHETEQYSDESTAAASTKKSESNKTSITQGNLFPQPTALTNICSSTPADTNVAETPEFQDFEDSGRIFAVVKVNEQNEWKNEIPVESGTGCHGDVCEVSGSGDEAVVISPESVVKMALDNDTVKMNEGGNQAFQLPETEIEQRTVSLPGTNQQLYLSAVITDENYLDSESSQPVSSSQLLDNDKYYGVKLASGKPTSNVKDIYGLEWKLSQPIEYNNIPITFEAKLEGPHLYTESESATDEKPLEINTVETRTGDETEFMISAPQAKCDENELTTTAFLTKSAAKVENKFGAETEPSVQAEFTSTKFQDETYVAELNTVTSGATTDDQELNIDRPDSETGDQELVSETNENETIEMFSVTPGAETNEPELKTVAPVAKTDEQESIFFPEQTEIDESEFNIVDLDAKTDEQEFIVDTVENRNNEPELEVAVADTKTDDEDVFDTNETETDEPKSVVAPDHKTNELEFIVDTEKKKTAEPVLSVVASFTRIDEQKFLFSAEETKADAPELVIVAPDAKTNELEFSVDTEEAETTKPIIELDAKTDAQDFIIETARAMTEKSDLNVVAPVAKADEPEFNAGREEPKTDDQDLNTVTSVAKTDEQEFIVDTENRQTDEPESNIAAADFKTDNQEFTVGTVRNIPFQGGNNHSLVLPVNKEFCEQDSPECEGCAPVSITPAELEEATGNLQLDTDYESSASGKCFDDAELYSTVVEYEQTFYVNTKNPKTDEAELNIIAPVARTNDGEFIGKIEETKTNEVKLNVVTPAAKTNEQETVVDVEETNIDEPELHIEPDEQEYIVDTEGTKTDELELSIVPAGVKTDEQEFAADIEETKTVELLLNISKPVAKTDEQKCFVKIKEVKITELELKILKSVAKADEQEYVVDKEEPKTDEQEFIVNTEETVKPDLNIVPPVAKTDAQEFSVHMEETKTDKHDIYIAAQDVKIDEHEFDVETKESATDGPVSTTVTPDVKTDEQVFTVDSDGSETDELQFNILTPVAKTDEQEAIVETEEFKTNIVAPAAKTDEQEFIVGAEETKTDETELNIVVTDVKTKKQEFTVDTVRNIHFQDENNHSLALPVNNEFCERDSPKFENCAPVYITPTELEETTTNKPELNIIVANVEHDKQEFGVETEESRTDELELTIVTPDAKTDEQEFIDGTEEPKTDELELTIVTPDAKTDEQEFIDGTEEPKTDELELTIVTPDAKTNEQEFIDGTEEPKTDELELNIVAADAKTDEQEFIDGTEEPKTDELELTIVTPDAKTDEQEFIDGTEEPKTDELELTIVTPDAKTDEQEFIDGTEEPKTDELELTIVTPDAKTDEQEFIDGTEEPKTDELELTIVTPDAKTDEQELIDGTEEPKTDELELNIVAADAKTDEQELIVDTEETKTNESELNIFASYVNIAEQEFFVETEESATDELELTILTPDVKTDKCQFSTLTPVVKTDEQEFIVETEETKTDESEFNNATPVAKTDERDLTVGIEGLRADDQELNIVAPVARIDEQDSSTDEPELNIVAAEVMTHKQELAVGTARNIQFQDKNNHSLVQLPVNKEFCEQDSPTFESCAPVSIGPAELEEATGNRQDTVSRDSKTDKQEFIDGTEEPKTDELELNIVAADAKTDGQESALDIKETKTDEPELNISTPIAKTKDQQFVVETEETKTDETELNTVAAVAKIDEREFMVETEEAETSELELKIPKSVAKTDEPEYIVDTKELKTDEQQLVVNTEETKTVELESNLAATVDESEFVDDTLTVEVDKTELRIEAPVIVHDESRVIDESRDFKCSDKSSKIAAPTYYDTKLNMTTVEDVVYEPGTTNDEAPLDDVTAEVVADEVKSNVVKLEAMTDEAQLTLVTPEDMTDETELNLVVPIAETDEVTPKATSDEEQLIVVLPNAVTDKVELNFVTPEAEDCETELNVDTLVVVTDGTELITVVPTAVADETELTIVTPNAEDYDTELNVDILVVVTDGTELITVVPTAVTDETELTVVTPKAEDYDTELDVDTLADMTDGTAVISEVELDVVTTDDMTDETDGNVDTLVVMTDNTGLEVEPEAIINEEELNTVRSETVAGESDFKFITHNIGYIRLTESGQIDFNCNGDVFEIDTSEGEPVEVADDNETVQNVLFQDENNESSEKDSPEFQSCAPVSITSEELEEATGNIQLAMDYESSTSRKCFSEGELYPTVVGKSSVPDMSAVRLKFMAEPSICTLQARNVESGFTVSDNVDCHSLIWEEQSQTISSKGANGIDKNKYRRVENCDPLFTATETDEDTIKSLPHSLQNKGRLNEKKTCGLDVCLTTGDVCTAPPVFGPSQPDTDEASEPYIGPIDRVDGMFGQLQSGQSITNRNELQKQRTVNFKSVLLENDEHQQSNAGLQPNIEDNSSSESNTDEQDIEKAANVVTFYAIQRAQLKLENDCLNILPANDTGNQGNSFVSNFEMEDFQIVREERSVDLSECGIQHTERNAELGDGDETASIEEQLSRVQLDAFEVVFLEKENRLITTESCEELSVTDRLLTENDLSKEPLEAKPSESDVNTYLDGRRQNHLSLEEPLNIFSGLENDQSFQTFEEKASVSPLEPKPNRGADERLIESCEPVFCFENESEIIIHKMFELDFSFMTDSRVEGGKTSCHNVEKDSQNKNLDGGYDFLGTKKKGSEIPQNWNDSQLDGLKKQRFTAELNTTSKRSESPQSIGVQVGGLDARPRHISALKTNPRPIQRETIVTLDIARQRLVTCQECQTETLLLVNDVATNTGQPGGQESLISKNLTRDRKCRICEGRNLEGLENKASLAEQFDSEMKNTDLESFCSCPKRLGFVETREGHVTTVSSSAKQEEAADSVVEQAAHFCLQCGAALRVTEGMKKEQESLVKQLDMLRDMNQKLRDDKDTIEAAHQAMLMTRRTSRGHSLSDELAEAERKHKKVDRQGSNMSKYFGGNPKLSSSSHSPKLRRQGPFESIGEERDADGESEDGRSSKHKSRGSYGRSEGKRSRRRSNGSKRSSRRVKKQGSVMSNYFDGSSGSLVDPDVLQLAVQEGVEFEGDVELGKVATEVKPVDERPAWALKIMACVDAKEKEKAVHEAALRQAEGVEGDSNTAGESETTTTEEGSEDVFEKEDQVQVFSKINAEHMKATEKGTGHAFDEENEVQVFRTKKAQYASGKTGEDRFKQYSGMSTATEDTTDGESAGERPTSPRAAPVGKDDEIAPSKVEPINPVPTQPERVFKVVFVGDSGVGKSSFIHRLCHDQWKPSFTATIGVDFQIKTLIVNGRCIAIQLWDTAGQERFRSITKQYFRKADGILVFYDVTMESSFINLKSWMTSIEEGADDRAAVMMIGSKTDLAEESDFRAVKTDDGEKLAESYKALYMETSAKTGSNIVEAIQKLAEVLQEREDDLMQDALRLTDKSTKKKCCKSS